MDFARKNPASKDSIRNEFQRQILGTITPGESNTAALSSSGSGELKTPEGGWDTDVSTDGPGFFTPRQYNSSESDRSHSAIKLGSLNVSTDSIDSLSERRDTLSPSVEKGLLGDINQDAAPVCRRDTLSPSAMFDIMQQGAFASTTDMEKRKTLSPVVMQELTKEQRPFKRSTRRDTVSPGALFELLQSGSDGIITSVASKENIPRTKATVSKRRDTMSPSSLSDFASMLSSENAATTTQAPMQVDASKRTSPIATNKNRRRDTISPSALMELQSALQGSDSMQLSKPLTRKSDQVNSRTDVLQRESRSKTRDRKTILPEEFEDLANGGNFITSVAQTQILTESKTTTMTTKTSLENSWSVNNRNPYSKEMTGVEQIQTEEESTQPMQDVTSEATVHVKMSEVRKKKRNLTASPNEIHRLLGISFEDSGNDTTGDWSVQAKETITREIQMTKPNEHLRRATISPRAFSSVKEVAGASTYQTTRARMSINTMESSPIQSPQDSKSLKSCMSAKKSKSHTPSRNVVFGSPRGAEFNKGSPSTSMTPLCNQAVKQMFPVDALDVDEDELVEDAETSLNASILEEADSLYSEEEEDDDDENEEKEKDPEQDHNKNAASTASTAAGVASVKQRRAVAQRNLSSPAQTQRSRRRRSSVGPSRRQAYGEYKRKRRHSLFTSSDMEDTVDEKKQETSLPLATEAAAGAAAAADVETETEAKVKVKVKETAKTTASMGGRRNGREEGGVEAQTHALLSTKSSAGQGPFAPTSLPLDDDMELTGDYSAIAQSVFKPTSMFARVEGLGDLIAESEQQAIGDRPFSDRRPLRDVSIFHDEDATVELGQLSDLIEEDDLFQQGSIPKIAQPQAKASVNVFSGFRGDEDMALGPIAEGSEEEENSKSQLLNASTSSVESERVAPSNLIVNLSSQFEDMSEQKTGSDSAENAFHSDISMDVSTEHSMDLSLSLSNTSLEMDDFHGNNNTKDGSTQQPSAASELLKSRIRQIGTHPVCDINYKGKDRGSQETKSPWVEKKNAQDNANKENENNNNEEEDVEDVEEDDSIAPPTSFVTFSSLLGLDLTMDSLSLRLDEIDSSTELVDFNATSDLEFACSQLPRLELMASGCDIVRNWEDDIVADMIKEIDSTNPPLFQCLAGGKTRVSELTDIVQRVLGTEQASVMCEWFQWRGQLAQGICNEMLTNTNKLDEDLQLIDQIYQKMDGGAQKLDLELAALNELISSEQQATSLLEAIIEQDSIESEYKNSIQQLTSALVSLQTEKGELEEHAEKLREDFSTQEEQTATIEEIQSAYHTANNYLERFNIQSGLSGFRVLSISPNTIELCLEYPNRISYTLHISCASKQEPPKIEFSSRTLGHLKKRPYEESVLSTLYDWFLYDKTLIDKEIQKMHTPMDLSFFVQSVEHRLFRCNQFVQELEDNLMNHHSIEINGTSQELSIFFVSFPKKCRFVLKIPLSKEYPFVLPRPIVEVVYGQVDVQGISDYLARFNAVEYKQLAAIAQRIQSEFC